MLSAVNWYVEGLSKRSGIATSLDVHPSKFPKLAPELETAIFRIIQEALTNVFRHSKAEHAWVTLRWEDSHVLLGIRDDGHGVEQEVLELRPGSIGVGIGGMKERIQELSGQLKLANAAPGTLVEVHIPLVNHLRHTS